MLMQKIRQKLQDEKGFTLMELMVVIAIIGILAAVSLPRFTAATTSANLAKNQSELRNIMAALEIYASENGGLYPNSKDDAAKALAGAGKYLKEWPKGSDNKDADYKAVDNRKSYELSMKVKTSDGEKEISNDNLIPH